MDLFEFLLQFYRNILREGFRLYRDNIWTFFPLIVAKISLLSPLCSFVLFHLLPFLLALGRYPLPLHHKQHQLVYHFELIT